MAAYACAEVKPPFGRSGLASYLRPGNALGQGRSLRTANRANRLPGRFRLREALSDEAVAIGRGVRG